MDLGLDGVWARKVLIFANNNTCQHMGGASRISPSQCGWMIKTQKKENRSLSDFIKNLNCWNNNY